MVHKITLSSSIVIRAADVVLWLTHKTGNGNKL